MYAFVSQRNKAATAAISTTLITPLVLTPPLSLILGSNRRLSHIPGGETLHLDQKLLVKNRSKSSAPDIGAI